MLLSNLKIINKNNEVIRSVNFHEGVNLVVDSEKSTEHNKTGKTTFLRLIDLALGYRDKKSIYKDNETGVLNRNLMDFIEHNKTSIELTTVSNFSLNNLKYTLKVDLFDGGKRYINGKNMNYNAYNEELNKIFFKNEDNIPRFRQLIKSFVRVSSNRDDNVFLKNIPSAKNITYRGIYNYLYNISNPIIDKKLDCLQRNLKNLSSAKKEFKKLNDVKEIYSLNQTVRALKLNNKEIQEKISDITDENLFINNRKKMNDVRIKYTTLNNKISDLNFQINMNNEMIEKIISDNDKKVNKSLTKDFFTEIKKIIPDIHKTFEDLVRFNNDLQKNKLTYLKEINDNLKKKREDYSRQESELIDENGSLISLIENNKIDEYNDLIFQLSENTQNISKKEQLIKSLNEFENKEKEILKDIDDVKKKSENSNYLIKMDLFNKFFKVISHKINGEYPILTYIPDPNKFPLEIDNINNGTSSGTKKSLIASYDLSYQDFAMADNKKIPNFIIHDVLENIEGNHFKKIIDIANKNKSQYIVAVLKEKLDSSKISKTDQKNMTIIKLSKNDSLFLDK